MKEPFFFVVRVLDHGQQYSEFHFKYQLSNFFLVQNSSCIIRTVFLFTYSVSIFFSALALHFLHENKIAHMDLKPQNLLLSARQNPVLKLAGMNIIIITVCVLGLGWISIYRPDSGALIRD